MGDCNTCGGKKRTWAASQYRAELQRRSDIYQHLATLKKLVETTAKRTKAPVTVIELGVRSGVSTVAWLAGLEETRAKGRVWAVDVKEAPQKIRDHQLVTFVQGEDTDPAVLAKLPSHADIVFVDSDHTYELTQAEIETYAPRVKPGGSLVFHDTALPRFPHHKSEQPLFPVRTAVTEWTEAMSAEGREHKVDERTVNNGLMIVTLS